MVPSEHSSGASVRRGGITKAGNSVSYESFSGTPTGTTLAQQRPLEPTGHEHHRDADTGLRARAREDDREHRREQVQLEVASDVVSARERALQSALIEPKRGILDALPRGKSRYYGLGIGPGQQRKALAGESERGKAVVAGLPELSVAIAAVVYVSTWSGWFLTSGGWDRQWAATHPPSIIPAAVWATASSTSSSKTTFARAYFCRARRTSQ